MEEAPFLVKLRAAESGRYLRDNENLILVVVRAVPFSLEIW